jgi:hypothetical protein
MNSNLPPSNPNFSTPFRPSLSLLGLGLAALVTLALLTFNTFVTEARADSPIEGVWSFNGGRIAVQEQQPGVFSGTVVAATTFSLCAHPEGEQIWTGMTRQPDGSYWGNHQWFFETSECVRNPALGQTAWRVLQKAEGRYLRACFSEPGSNLQPTIAADGTVANATFGCVDSALVSVLPEVSAAAASRFIHLPDNDGCLSRRRLRVRIDDPKNDPVKRVVVTARGGGVKVLAKLHETKKGFVAILRLGKIPTDTFVVKVRLTTLLGEHLTSRQVYHRCLPGGAK